MNLLERTIQAQMWNTAAGRQRLHEQVSQAALRVDRPNGVLRGCKLLGWLSANNRRYEPAGVDPHLYDGVKVFAENHVAAHQQHDVRSLVAWVEKPWKANIGIFGDLLFVNPRSEFAEMCYSIAERKPSLIGLSHEADGVARRGDSTIIEKVEHVSALILTHDPASTAGLFESVTRRSGPAEPWTEAERHRRVCYLRALR